MARRSLFLILFFVVALAACSGSRAAPAVTSTPAAAVITAPPTAAPTPTASPTKAAPTKKPKKTKKPKPTPTPEVWSPAYRSHVCDAIGFLSDTTAHLDEAAARIGTGEFPKARAATFEIVSLVVKAKGEIDAATKWAPGDDLKGLLAASADTIGKGATHLLDGLAAVDFDAIGAAQAQIGTGRDQLARAQAAVVALAVTYGPAGC